jgi:hypothetical protein
MKVLGRVVSLSVVLGISLTSASAATPSTINPTLTAKIVQPSDLDDVSQIISSGSSWIAVGNVEQNAISSSPLFPNEASKGASDGYVAMLDSTLQLKWSHRFGTSHDDVATAVTRDGAGVIWAVAVTSKEVQPLPTPAASSTGTPPPPTLAPPTLAPPTLAPPSPTPTVNPDGVVPVTPPSAPAIADQLLISTWSNAGELLSQSLHSIVEGLAINPSRLVPTKSGVYVVGTAVDPQVGTSKGFYVLVAKDGSLGRVHWVGSNAVVLRGATLLSNGSLVVAGSVAEALRGKPAIGTTDAYVAVINPSTGVILRSQRSGSKSANSSWESVSADRAGNLAVTGLSQLGKRSDVVVASFSTSMTIKFSLRLRAPLGTQVVLPAPAGSFAAVALSSMRLGRKGSETFLAPIGANGRLIPPTYLVGKAKYGLVAAASGKGYLLASSDQGGLSLAWFAPRSGK